MKIGILIDRLNVGGVEKIAIEEVKALRKIGEDAYLVVLREKAVVPNAFPDLLQGVPVVYLDSRLPKLLRFSVPVPGFSFFSSFHLTYPFFLPFVLKKKEFDYFISHGTYTSISAVAIRKVKKIKLSAFIWDPASYILGRVYKTSFPNFVLYFFKKLAYVLDKFLINNVDNVLVGGDAHNSFIHKINPHKPIKTIYPSVHPIKKLVKKENYILMVTAWKNGKNPEYIFELASKLPKASFKMVGRWVDPLYREKFEASLSEKGLTKQVHVVGGVSEAELAHYYAHACVLLQTNDDRGFGMPALEAAGNGTSFIIPSGQGVCNLFVDGEDGFYTKEKDTKTIATLLNKMEDREYAMKTGTSAWKRVKDNYSWDKHAQEIKQIIKDTLKN